jgi:hypothetical protein
MYISGQERRLVNPPSQVVAGVRTVTTNMNGREALPRSRPFAFLKCPFASAGQIDHPKTNRVIQFVLSK